METGLALTLLQALVQILLAGRTGLGILQGSTRSMPGTAQAANKTADRANKKPPKVEMGLIPKVGHEVAAERSSGKPWYAGGIGQANKRRSADAYTRV